MEHLESESLIVNLDTEAAAPSAAEYYNSDVQALLARVKQERGGRKFLSLEEQMELAETIQSARQDIESQPRVQAELADTQSAHDKLVICLNQIPTESGVRPAMNTLIHNELAQAEYLARTSMNRINSKETAQHIDIRSLGGSAAVLEDRIQVANTALIKAAWMYDPVRNAERGQKPTRFGAFARRVIYADLFRYIRGSSETSIATFSDRMYSAARNNTARWDKMSNDKKWEIHQLNALEYPLNIDQITVEKMPLDGDVYNEVFERELRALIGKALGCLSERDRKVINYRFGFTTDNPRTLKDIGDELGLTPEGVRLIGIRALKMLRELEEINAIKDVYY